ncbi:hypothetical protein PR202_ga04379 [Eleusine coracana subsp. coracana]|uniref:Chlorophyll synthase n=1 Tax=Eleusine coracana subsp. coracana TaxID=191504 RepID=A0AAV5BSX0_ELECO|nr:hypothetical protein PR202_ga04379 [Eleusine coracana subsp. coracana]
MAAAHLLAAAASSSTPFRPLFRVLSPGSSPHLRLSRTGLTFACRFHSQGGGRSQLSARPRQTPKTVRARAAAAPPLGSIDASSCLCWRSQLLSLSDTRLLGCAAKAKGKAPDKAPAAGSSFNQLLGIKGAKQESDIWKIRLQLTKPVTWPPLVWGVLCGAAASGNFHWTVEDVAKSIVCMLMSGPCLTGYTQTINDWYDRDIDAINEPYRPIPSGAISENEVITQIWVLLLAGLGLGALLDVWAGHDFPIVFYLAVGGSLLSYIYSAPPLKVLHLWAGQALFGTLTPEIVVLTTFYSIAGLGIAIVNDFKSIEGDRTLGLQSLPVAFGMETAKWICVGAIDITQLSVAAYLFSTGKTYYALALLGLTIPQVIFQFNFISVHLILFPFMEQFQYFLKDPVKYDVKYQASAQPFFVLGLLVTALATSH